MDVGLPGGALHTANQARSINSVIEGDLQVSRRLFTFPGFHGGLAHNSGLRFRRVTWELCVRAIDLATLVVVEKNMDAAKIAGDTQMIATTGRTYARAVLDSSTPLGPWEKIRSGDLVGWVRREYRLEFTVLSAD